MCGRFVIAGNKAAIQDAFSVDETYQDELKPSWNVAPMQGIPFVAEQLREGTLVRRLEIARWGLVPVWSKDPKAGARMINARSETVTEKPSFRAAAAKRRALMPANGYYEWQKNEDGTKTPHYLHGQDEDQLLGFAGLYEFWPDPTKAEDADDKWLVTATILTRAAHDALGHIHDRTPVIIPKDLQDQWLDPTMRERNQVQHFIDTIPEPNLVPRIVGKEVGSVRNNGPQLVNGGCLMGITERPEAMSLAHRGMTGAVWRALDAARRKHLLSCAIAAIEAINWACAVDEQLRGEDPTYTQRRDTHSDGCSLQGLRYARDRAMHQVVITATKDDRGFFNPRSRGVVHIASSYPVWAPTASLPEPTNKRNHEDRKAAYDAHVAERSVWKPLFAALQFLTEELNDRVELLPIEQPTWFEELSSEDRAAISKSPMKQE